MFAYCNNNSVMLADARGNAPEEAIDTDGDGEDDCYVYSYTYASDGFDVFVQLVIAAIKTLPFLISPFDVATDVEASLPASAMSD